MGLPMVGLTSASTHLDTVAHTVVSVGPYALKKHRPGAQLATTFVEHASPATTIVRKAGKSSTSQAARMDGGRVTFVMRFSLNNLNKRAADNWASRLATQRAAPAQRAIVISKMEASKFKDAN